MSEGGWIQLAGTLEGTASIESDVRHTARHFMAPTRPRPTIRESKTQGFERVVRSLLPQRLATLDYERDQQHRLVAKMTMCFISVWVPADSVELELLRYGHDFARHGALVHPALIADLMLDIGMVSELVDLMDRERLARIHVRRVAAALDIPPLAWFATPELRALVLEMTSRADTLDARDAANDVLAEVLGACGA
jgi:hypothetical protein